MIIGFDIDGVIFNSMKVILEEYNSKFNTDFKQEQVTDYRVEKCLNLDPEYFRTLIDLVWVEKSHLIGLYEPKIPSLINSLRPKHKIVIVTKRRISTLPYVLHNLEKYGIIIDGVVCVNNGLEKSLANVDYLIDDSKEMIDKFHNYGFLLKRPYNEKYDVESVEQYIYIIRKMSEYNEENKVAV